MIEYHNGLRTELLFLPHAVGMLANSPKKPLVPLLLVIEPTTKFTPR